MSTVSRRFLHATIVATGLLIPGLAAAQMSETSISTGREDGNYYYIGERLKSKLLLDGDLKIDVQTSSGSVQNLARLADPSSDVGLALTQSDALKRFLQGNAEFANEFIVLGDAGKECVVLIAGKQSGMRRFADLKGLTGGEVSVDDPGSGAAATFDYLVAMDPGLARIKPVFVDTLEALLQIKVAGALTKIRAVMLVQRPSMRSRAVEILLANPGDYALIPILASDVKNSTLPDDSVVYTFEKVRVGSRKASGGVAVDTICTRSLLLASKDKLSRGIRSKLSLLMLNSARAVIGNDD